MGSPTQADAPAARLVVGVDIGNSTTEACIAQVDGQGVRYLGGGIARTSGIKGTTRNVQGVLEAISGALARAGRPLSALDTVLLNEATPVISGMAMETLTETVITESTMIGHDPATPGGLGLGVGVTVPFHALGERTDPAPVIVVIPGDVDYEDAASALEAARARGVVVRGAMVQRDDARLIGNRLGQPIPIVDEIALIDRVPLGMQAAVEVAPPGHTLRELSNPYGLATLFGLSAEETRLAAPISRALVGSRSAVVIRTPAGDITDRRIPAGALELIGERTRQTIDVTEGAEAIMRLLRRVQPLQDAVGAPGTNVGGMLARVRDTMAELTGDPPETVHIRDVLAVDTFVPREVRGGLAGEFALESAVALAAMVRTRHGAMARLAEVLTRELGCGVRVGGVEADMALRGALTTPGTERPVAVLDLGGGSTDAALANGQGEVRTTHVSGAGDLVTRLIASELGLEDEETAENVKRYPLAKVESLFQLRLENGQVAFFDAPLPAETFARVVALKEHGVLAPVPCRHPLEKIRQVRRDAKRRVFVVNALRALEQVAPGGNLRRLDFVVLLGGSALDFEIPELIADATAEYGIVCGTGNVRGTEGPRNAVATGLVAAHAEQAREG
ncbi:diol dehydratase reactivase subunit alpha [Corallococcus sp. CA047B]|uniref:diol dehydratase reactivase subunit alpha n=1 Tax=Corallococcus sp. CA047B TaxID=2316729 RepID=UPI000EA35497|nr:diol dehydratase reactivase subunit alpha [Corallococcus sp. CA047B]RKH20667.1 diol dehydratase reactivase subunit alpha [Corallococcus sp. CA047B]